MKVLFLMTVIMTSIALQVKNLVPAEQLKLLPVSAPHKENANTTNTFLQLSADPVVTCESSVDNYGWGIWADGKKVADKGKFTMPVNTNVLSVFAGDAENGCSTGGFRLKCKCDKCVWDGFTTTTSNKWLVYSSNTKTAPAANWYKSGFDDSKWPKATYASRNTDANWKSICGKKGKNWWFRTTQQNPATTEAATEEPSSTEAGTRSSVAINLDFSKLVHEKFSQEAAHGTWNLHLNLDTDPCSLLTCKAESQCHAVGTCTKAGGGVCTTPFLAKDTECDDEVEETDNDVCDGEGGCAGINIGLGCLEMRFDASKFKEGYLVTTWKDLAKKGHDATAHSTVPRVLMDQTDKKRPYVPVIKGKWWNVPGNTFLKTIVSVFRSGDNRAGWHGHGATLARRSGRNSNWLFENGNGRLHGNQYPDKVWKNGKALTSPFDMAPINKFFVLVVQVNDRDRSAKTYYLGRGDADTSRVDIQEELGYDRILTDVERKQVESFLMKKWNIEN